MALSGAQLTRLGLSGFPRQPNGGFGKQIQPITGTLDAQAATATADIAGTVTGLVTGTLAAQAATATASITGTRTVSGQLAAQAATATAALRGIGGEIWVKVPGDDTLWTEVSNDTTLWTRVS